MTLTACANNPGELAAVDGTRRLVVRDTNTGLTVVLTTGAWDGVPPFLEEELTVLHVLIANMGSAPVRLAPGDFELRDDRGFHYELYDAGGSFRLAAPGEGGSQPVAHPVTYHRGASDDFEVIDAPGTDVAASALPWGVLQPGTQMRGFLYFEPLDTANKGDLVWHVHTANDAPLVDLSFALYVFR
ncbi:MAG: hypothetical protein KC468_04900 [Myxococcales bacterium]|nr:hypothetical protein [Myxococcales bacterium]